MNRKYKSTKKKRPEPSLASRFGLTVGLQSALAAMAPAFGSILAQRAADLRECDILEAKTRLANAEALRMLATAHVVREETFEPKS